MDSANIDYETPRTIRHFELHSFLLLRVAVISVLMLTMFDSWAPRKSRGQHMRTIRTSVLRPLMLLEDRAR